MEIRRHFDTTFYNDFYKRVSIFLNYYEHLFGSSKIILSIISEEQVYYKGLDCMDLPKNEENQKMISYLNTHGYDLTDKRYLTSRLFKRFHDKNLSSQDFGPVDISPFIQTGESALKEYEKRLIKSCISSGQRYSCISIPLIAMASFVGAINIIWQPRRKVNNDLLLSSVEVLTKMFTREYESMLVFRDLDFLDEAKNIELKHQYDLLTRKSQIHPFLAKLGYPEYYRVFGEQFLRYNQKIIDVKNKVDSQDIKTAIISIVVDSFAHNVGAHSLTALKWWIQKRSEFLDYKFKFGKEHTLKNFAPQEIGFQHLRQISKNHTEYYQKIGRKDMKKSLTSLMSIIKHMPEDLEHELLSFDSVYRDYKNEERGTLIPRFPMPIDDGVWPFLEYMRDKSAFWSGVSRDIVYTGEAISWYDLIWGDFINNPLFLGTIAHSEGIHKLNVSLTVLDENGKIVQQGMFAKIDLSVIEREISQVAKLYNDGSGQTPEHVATDEDEGLDYSTYGFIRLAEEFTVLKEALEQLPEVFLPNGIIGKHAFYTILENTLRNVKHFKDEYQNMQQNGINFHISIQPHRYEDQERKMQIAEENLFEVGVWLQHPIRLISEDHNATTSKPVFFKYYQRLSESIVNQYGRPNLGGNSQDKICAAMLLNNTFKSVVEMNPEEAKVGYRPYVHIESIITSDLAKNDDGVYRPQIQPLENKALEEETAKYLKRFPLNSMGYIKKYLYMWKAESLKIVDNQDFDVRAENLSRFRIIAAKNISLPEAKDKFRLHGVIRIVSYESISQAPEIAEERFAYAYLMWLREWLNWEEGRTIQTLISIRNTPVGLLQLNAQGEVSYQNYMDLYGHFDLNNFQGRRIELSHGDQQGGAAQQLCEIRSHGTFLKYFYAGSGFSGINNYRFAQQSLLIELFEAIDTKVCVIDNRVHKRMPENKRETLVDQLNLHFFPERDAVWHQEKADMLKGCNFLILHLSFIESFEHQKYTANQIDEFVNKEIGMLEELPENFIVVITTGRGRSGWLETIENPKITFRPIESLVDALEDGLSMQDFFQIKYNLVKVLMGS